MDKPIIVFSTQRSGSSLFTQILQRAGVFVGESQSGDRYNVDGYYENLSINALIIGYLRSCDVYGLDYRYHPTDLPPAGTWFKHSVLEVLRREGFSYDKYRRWVYKHPWNVFVWRTWHELFTDAYFVIVRRDREDIINSIERCPWINSYESRAEWRRMIGIYEHIFSVIEKVHDKVFTINMSKLMKGEHVEIERCFGELGIEYDRSVLNCVKSEYWNR